MGAIQTILSGIKMSGHATKSLQSLGKKNPSVWSIKQRSSKICRGHRLTPIWGKIGKLFEYSLSKIF